VTSDADGEPSRSVDVTRPASDLVSPLVTGVTSLLDNTIRKAARDAAIRGDLPGNEPDPVHPRAVEQTARIHIYVRVLDSVGTWLSYVAVVVFVRRADHRIF
jgi:hypothetical protein